MSFEGISLPQRDYCLRSKFTPKRNIEGLRERGYILLRRGHRTHKNGQGQQHSAGNHCPCRQARAHSVFRSRKLPTSSPAEQVEQIDQGVTFQRKSGEANKAKDGHFAEL